MNRWRKMGLVYAPNASTQHPKLISHASNPVATHLRDDVYRVFFSGRDRFNRSSVGAVDVDVVNATVVKTYSDPLFVHGAEGTFFKDGVSVGCAYNVGSQQYLLFMGWQSPPTEHWRGDIGRLLVSRDLQLQLDDESPFLGVTDIDPISLSYPWVINRGDLFLMYYGSTVSWCASNNEMIHTINAAVSKDGHRWDRIGQVVPHQIGTAQAFSRPTVVPSSNHSGYDMWFSYRSGTGQKYRIGYAHSSDGLMWSMDLENAGIDVSDTGWDSEMIEYPCVFDHRGVRYMLYNGNGFGMTGFGLARLE